MKAGFISDIHGNYEALKTVLAELDSMNITKVYCLGDVVGYYTQINECCNALISRQIPCVMGNHDWYFAGGSFCPRSQSVNDCLEYLRTVITGENMEWLKTFPLHREVGNIKMVHGGWMDPIDEYIKPTEKYFSRISGDVFVSGHTHIQTIQEFGKKTYCNPGSVGQPRDNDPRAAFAVYDAGAFSLHRVEYDMQKVFDLMQQAGFDDYYYGCLKSGSRNLRKL